CTPVHTSPIASTPAARALVTAAIVSSTSTSILPAWKSSGGKPRKEELSGTLVAKGAQWGDRATTATNVPTRCAPMLAQAAPIEAATPVRFRVFADAGLFQLEGFGRCAFADVAERFAALGRILGARR